MTNERIARPIGPVPGAQSVTMRGPADMAELLPYLMGFFPDDSIVAVGLQGPDLHQGGVIRLDIPDSTADWPTVAKETAELLTELSAQRYRRPEQVLLYLCQDPGDGHGPPTVERLGPLAERLRTSFEQRGVVVKESLCISGGRWWSFLCRGEGCCDPGGNPIRRFDRAPGPVSAAAAFAGLAPRGSRKSIVTGLSPVGPPVAEGQRLAIARALAGAPGGGAVETLGGSAELREQSAALLDRAVVEFAAGARELDEERAAVLLVALRDRQLRDRAAEYAESGELAPAQRLWRFLARRCVPPYTELAAPPLTLLAWTSWVAGDTATARVVLAHTLRLDPSYLLAQLLYESLNGGLTPELLLEGVRAERARRAKTAGLRSPAEELGSGDDPEDGSEPVPKRPGGGSPTRGGACLQIEAAPPVGPGAVEAAAGAASTVHQGAGDQYGTRPAAGEPGPGTVDAPGTEVSTTADIGSDPADTGTGSGTGPGPDPGTGTDAFGAGPAGPLSPGLSSPGAPPVGPPPVGGYRRAQAHRVPGCRPAAGQAARSAASCDRPAAGPPASAKVRLGRFPRQTTAEARRNCRGTRRRPVGSRHV
ncbi:DUF4192 domain-containing protein [Kitasatospora sp. NPDC054939]